MNKAQEAKKIVVSAVDNLNRALIEERDDFIDEIKAKKIYEQQDQLIKELEKIHGGRKWMYECFKAEKLVIREGMTTDGVRGFVAIDENTGVIVSSRPSLESLMLDLDKRKNSYEKKIGRPAEMAGGKPVKVYLDTESIATAQRLGNGNVSEGIRKALKATD